MSSFRLAGKAALVTGAARGIGLETARALHQRGARVVITDLDGTEAAEAAGQIGDGALGLAGDASDRDSLDEIVATTVERFGGLDVAVANAGIAPTPRPLASIDPQEFERVLEVNLLGVYRTVHAALPQVIRRRGHIVILGSIYSFMNGAMVTPYAASKAAVEQLGRALRVELAGHGAGATVVYPGFVDTRLVREGFADPVAKRFEELMPDFVLRRITPQLVASRIVAGIERRAPRVIVPRWWTAVSTLRGLLNPLTDAALTRDARFQVLIEQAEAQRSRTSKV